LRNKFATGIGVVLACVVASFIPTPVFALDTTKLIQAVQAEESALQARVGMTVFDETQERLGTIGAMSGFH
jgi:hypothetical protein